MGSGKFNGDIKFIGNLFIRSASNLPGKLPNLLAILTLIFMRDYESIVSFFIRDSLKPPVYWLSGGEESLF